MPPTSNPLETALRQIKDHLVDMEILNPFAQEEVKGVMTPLRAILINFRNLETGVVKFPQLLFCDRCMCSYTTKCQCSD